MIGIEITFTKPLPVEKIDKFMDRTVYSVARTTLDITEPNIPEKTGKLKSSSYTLGVKGGNKNYHIGTEADYGVYVWNMQQGVNWTNKATKAQWFYTVFSNNKEQIISQAIKNALGTVIE